MSKSIARLLLLCCCAVPALVQASSIHGKPGQVSSTCSYNEGPKLGQTEDLQGKIKPVAIGKVCTDGAGSSGLAVFDAADEAAEEAEEAAKAAAAQAAVNARNQRPQASTCKFYQGKKAGQQESYQGKIQPLPVGETCTDGLGSIGVVVPD